MSLFPRVLCIITYLFAIGITIWALYQPYMTTEIYGDKIDEYFDKQCINNKCDSPLPLFADSGKALNALYITFIILASLCLALSFTKYTKICNIVGLLLLGMALAVIITLIIFIKTLHLEITVIDKEFYYNITTASILVIVVCCLMIVKQLTYNNILHSIGRAIFSKLKH